MEWMSGAWNATVSNNKAHELPNTISDLKDKNEPYIIDFTVLAVSIEDLEKETLPFLGPG